MFADDGEDDEKDAADGDGDEQDEECRHGSQLSTAQCTTVSLLVASLWKLLKYENYIPGKAD